MQDARRGAVSAADRLQRLIIAVILMGLTLLGLLRDPNWLLAIALAVQIELLLTALAGWCPIYWACRIHTEQGR